MAGIFSTDAYMKLLKKCSQDKSNNSAYTKETICPGLGFVMVQAISNGAVLR